MSDVTGILNIASQALMTQQKAISVTSHNIANVNTPGYSRQTLQLSTNTPLNTSPGLMGNGVQAETIEREYNRFLNAQINDENQGLGRWDAQKDAVEMIEVIFNESDGYGLSRTLSEFWDAWQSLTNNPAGPAERQVLVSTSQVLADHFNRLDADLRQSQENLDIAVQGTVADINRLTQEVVDLNMKIISAETGSTNANDYRDQRDQVLKELAGLIDINTYEDSNGAAHVLVADGRPLVSASESWQLSTEARPSGLHDIVWLDDSGSSTDITNSINGGKLKGYVEVRDAIITSDVSRLDALASALITDINTLHQTGFALDGTTGEVFFNGVDAGSIELNTLIAGDPNLIAAADDIATIPGDNLRAIEIADLQYQLRMSGNTATYNDYYSALIRDAGNEVIKSESHYRHQSDMMAQLENRREAISGVSLDEEMINLIKFQNAYAAAAKMISAADEMMQTVLQLV